MDKKLSVRLMIKYLRSGAPDPFAVVCGIFNKIKYHGESAAFSEERATDNGSVRRVLSVKGSDAKADGSIDSYDIAIEFLSSDMYGYLLLEIFIDDGKISQDTADLLECRADLLLRYLREWICRCDALYASIHTSLEPLAFSDLDEKNFPSRIGWATYFGEELCVVIGKELLLGAKIIINYAYGETGRPGVLWMITGSITQRPGTLGDYSSLRHYLNNNLFRLMHLVEDSYYSLKYTITGKAVFTAISDDVVSGFKDIVGCELEQYKDMWDTVDGYVFGMDVGLSYNGGEDGHGCALSVKGNFRDDYRSDVIEIDVTDYLYTLVRAHSMTPDLNGLGICYRRPKETMYALTAHAEFTHAKKMDALSDYIIAAFDCTRYDLAGDVLTMRMFGLLLTVTLTHEYAGRNYYSLDAAYDGAVDDTWRYIDVSEYVITLLKTEGIICGRDLVF